MRFSVKSILLFSAATLCLSIPSFGQTVDTLQAERADSIYNGTSYPATIVTNLWSSGYLRFDNVDFGTTPITWINIHASTVRAYASNVIIYTDVLDTVAGTTAVDTVTIGAPIKDNFWELSKPLTGVHTLYIYSAWGPITDVNTGTKRKDGVQIDYISFHTSYPLTTDPFQIIEFEKYDYSPSPPALTRLGTDTSAITIDNFWKANYVVFRSVAFGTTPVDSITIAGLYKNWSGVTPLYITLDSPDTLVGKVVKKAGIGMVYNNYRMKLDSTITGTHDLYFRSYVPSGDGYQLDYFTFGQLKKDVVRVEHPKSMVTASVSALVTAGKRGIEFSVPQGTRSISIFRADGTRVITAPVSGSRGSINAKFAAGTYLVEIAGSGKTIRQSLVISR